MAEPLISFVAQSVLSKLGSLAYQEVSLACGVKNDLEKFKNTVNTIKAVLLDADEQQGQNQQVRVWLEKLRDTFYDAEDVLDEFEVEALRGQVVDRQSITRKVRHFFSCSNPLALRFMMAHKIKGIRERLDEIVADKANFHLPSERTDHKRVLFMKDRETHSFVPPSYVIGRDKDKENIINLLMQPCDGETISVIPIIGIGGLGKTALAKLVYNDERVQKQFELKMWVCVADEFVMKQLITKVIKSAIDQNHDNLDLEQLQQLLRDTLGSKRYLLVMDDVWNEDSKKWIELKNLLWEGANGSKIIVTTRSNRVASIMSTMRDVNGYKLEGLPYKSCKFLFFKCAFKEGEKEKHPNLIKLGKEIVKKCGGIPLAVKSLGSLLYSSTNEQDWKHVRDNEIWKLDQKENDVLPALRLSYDVLPSHLKQCFAYCSLFPKDYEFASDELIRFWMAQGFLQPSNENDELENIGMRYLRELWSRSFFQDFDQEIYLVRFKMHDLIHDLALLVAKDDYLIVNSNSQDISKKVRHLSFVSVNTSKKKLLDPGHVRTISFLFNEEGCSQSFAESCISRLQLVRVLELSNSNIEVLPKKIGNLKHLRFLGLSNCRRIKKLSKSICKLQSLQTLYLNECKELKELP